MFNKNNINLKFKILKVTIMNKLLNKLFIKFIYFYLFINLFYFLILNRYIWFQAVKYN